MVSHFTAIILCIGVVLLAPGAAAVDLADSKVGLVNCISALLAESKPGLVTPTGDQDLVLRFLAYVSNFDGSDDDNGDGVSDLLRVPNWVAQRIKVVTGFPESPVGSTRWFTAPCLDKQELAPAHDSYRFLEDFPRSHANWFDGGHLAQKYLAERVGSDGGWFSHSVANAAPQRSLFNSHPWLELECRTGAWANHFGGAEDIWVITGPVFVLRTPFQFLPAQARGNALSVAVPEYMFKIVVRRAGGHLEWLALHYPQDDDAYQPKAPMGSGALAGNNQSDSGSDRLRFFEGFDGMTTDGKA